MPVTMIVNATQIGGPGEVISVSGSNMTAVPEPAPWMIMLLRFLGLAVPFGRR